MPRTAARSSKTGWYRWVPMTGYPARMTSATVVELYWQRWRGPARARLC